MTGRPEDGYEVRYRLDAGRTLRGVLAIVASVLVAGAWLATTLLSPRPADRADGDRTTATGTEAPLARATGPTLPPSIERRFGIPDTQIPFVSEFGGFGQVAGLGGLAWLDTADGQMRPPAEHADPRWLFEEADGSMLCVCLRQVVGAPPQYELRSFGALGEDLRLVSLRDWRTTFVERTVTDAVVDPTGQFLYAAWARETGPERWTIGLDVVSRDDGTSRTTDLADVKTSHTLGSPVDVRLWLSPDARHARIRFATIDGLQQLAAPADEGWWAWTVPIALSIPGEAIPVDEPSMPVGAGCFAEGWATNEDFVAACGGPVNEPGGVVTIRASSLDGSHADLQERFDVAGLAWLLSQTSGQLFLWAPTEGALWRVDVPSLAVIKQRLAPADVDISGSDWSLPAESGASWWPRGWQQRPPWLDQRQLVGSRDGAVVYGLGTLPTRSVGDNQPATVIWAFDARSLAVIAHWTSVGAYSTLALTPSGDQVIAAGGPTSEELAAFGSLGATIAFHDAKGDGISLILRGVNTWPTFLVSEPPPKPT